MQLLVCVSLAWRDGNQSVIGLCKQRVRHRLQVFQHNDSFCTLVVEALLGNCLLRRFQTIYLFQLPTATLIQLENAAVVEIVAGRFDGIRLVGGSHGG